MAGIEPTPSKSNDWTGQSPELGLRRMKLGFWLISNVSYSSIHCNMVHVILDNHCLHDAGLAMMNWESTAIDRAEDHQMA